MRRRNFGAIFLTLLVLFVVVGTVNFARAQSFPGDQGVSGLVPCGDPDEPACEACNVMGLSADLLRLAVYLSVLIAVIMFSYAGYTYITAQGDPGKVSDAHRIFMAVTIGLVVVLGSWTVVDTLLKTFLNDQVYGPWNRIQCVPQPQVGGNRPVTPEGGVGVGAQPTTGVSPRGQAAQAAATDAWRSEIERRAAEYNIDPQIVQAIMMQESGGRAGVVSSAGAIGLMQVMPDTARDIDRAIARASGTTPIFAGMSNDQIQNYLTTNTSANIQFGTYYVAQQYQRFSGDLSLTAAAYNGGPGANRASVTCAGVTVWQCEANRGYAETRNYVQIVTSNYNYLRNRAGSALERAIAYFWMNWWLLTV